MSIYFKTHRSQLGNSKNDIQDKQRIGTSATIILMILEDATQDKKKFGAVFRGLVDGTCFIKHTTMFPV
jgi:hypothetical protein